MKRKKISKKKIKTINGENKIELNVGCRTSFEDGECRDFYNRMNKVLLFDLEIKYPIRLSKTQLILKGDITNLPKFSFSGVKSLFEYYYEFNKTDKIFLLPEIFYFKDDFIPYLIINIFKINEHPTLYTEETFNKLFPFNDKIKELECDESEIEKFVKSVNGLTTKVDDLLKGILIPYDLDYFTPKRLDYLKNNLETIEDFNNLFLSPISPVKFIEETGQLSLFEYIK